ncbi:hypothetical protein BCR36DRAFT_350808 [Piromyces finnis]|uniref:SH3 domain-containing protein n=1 Tax=Piromyces finnis TaxID=1754191 RepID=A0A1Y1VBC5_9FUNG|nr:hypothetical protein BCR36DRAFT_350808 [Piromyces finnis]|eukprot:ORX51793.1 hypothetical protein BCR36DRAFT_350808 [Piromyces finnis]
MICKNLNSPFYGEMISAHPLKKLKTLFTLSFVGLLFSNISVISAQESEINQKVGFNECPICFDQEMVNSLTQECSSIPTDFNFNTIDDESLICLCNMAKKIPAIEQCQICAGITPEEFQEKCTEMENLEDQLSRNPISNKYVTDNLINDNLSKEKSMDNEQTKTSNKESDKNFIILYGIIGGGILFITTAGLFISRRISNNHAADEEIQMDHVNNFDNLNVINIDQQYNNKNGITPLEPSMPNNKVSNHHYNDNMNMYRLPPTYPTTSTSEPILNKERPLNQTNQYNRKITSTPNIRGILVKRGRDYENYMNDERRSSLSVNSHQENPAPKNYHKKPNKPRVTFSKGLTTMHEFLSDNWNKSIEYEELKTNSLINLGWHIGIVIHNFNPNKDDEIKLRIGDGVIVRLAFDDGWAYAFNRNTGVVGMIPIVCIKPVKSLGK